MTLRLATLDDLPLLLEFAKQFHENSPYVADPFDEEKVAAVLHAAVLDKHKGIAIFYLDNDKEVGVIVGVLSELVFNREPVASEVMWWVDPKHRTRKSLSLKEAFEFWGKRMGVKYIHMTAPAASPKVSRFYERAGYEPYENAYMKRIG